MLFRYGTVVDKVECTSDVTMGDTDTNQFDEANEKG